MLLLLKCIPTFNEPEVVFHKVKMVKRTEAVNKFGEKRRQNRAYRIGGFLNRFVVTKRISANRLNWKLHRNNFRMIYRSLAFISLHPVVARRDISVPENLLRNLASICGSKLHLYYVCACAPFPLPPIHLGPLAVVCPTGQTPRCSTWCLF